MTEDEINKMIVNKINEILFNWDGEIYVGKRVLNVVTVGPASINLMGFAYNKVYTVKEELNSMYNTTIHTGHDLLTALNVLIQGE